MASRLYILAYPRRQQTVRPGQPDPTRKKACGECAVTRIRAGHRDYGFTDDATGECEFCGKGIYPEQPEETK